jgi:hypothetical protein
MNTGCLRRERLMLVELVGLIDIAMLDADRFAFLDPEYVALDQEISVLVSSLGLSDAAEAGRLEL